MVEWQSGDQHRCYVAESRVPSWLARAQGGAQAAEEASAQNCDATVSFCELHQRKECTRSRHTYITGSICRLLVR